MSNSDKKFYWLSCLIAAIVSGISSYWIGGMGFMSLVLLLSAAEIYSKN